MSDKSSCTRIFLFLQRSESARPVATLATLAGWLLAAPAFAVDWPQWGVNSRHTGTTLQEINLNTGNVATLHLFINGVALPSVADGAPAYLTGVATAMGTKDLLFLNTKDGRILALDAATGATVWAKRPATGPNYTTSSPAIDPSRLYVYAYSLEGKVHKYQVGDGTEITTGGWPQVATLKPSVEKGSAALSLATAQNGTSYLYVSNGGYPGDAGDYQGHVTAINLSTGAQKVFNVDCSDQTVHFVISPGTPDCSGHVQSAVWARPGVIYDSDLDKIFFSTGNGDYDGNTGGHDWGDSTLALNPDGTGSGGLPIDAYTPVEFQTLQNNDADLGSTAPAILPPIAGSHVAHLGVQSGKDAQLRLLDLDNLSGAGAPGHIGGELQKIGVPQGGEVLTQPAVWVNPVDNQAWYFVANGSGISGLKVSADGMGNPHLASQWSNATGGTSPVVANGILFYASDSGLFALDPTNGNQLFHDASIGSVHWESVIVANGRLYITDEGSKLWGYEPNAAPLSFFTVTPCRAVDTRQPNGPFGGPVLSGSAGARSFALAGQCGVPANAQAVAANVTVVGATTSGDLRLLPSGVVTQTSTINFAAGAVRANNEVISLTGDPLGSIVVLPDLAGFTNLLIDVSGYFK
jgi:hypothetical protein